MLDAVVIGAGQAGLATSYWLTQRGLSHVVLERGHVGESWRTQRWDSFVLNTPSAVSVLPGDPYSGDDPEGFWTCDELLARFRGYVDRFGLPVRQGVTVVEVDSMPHGFAVRTEPGEELEAKNIVVASGLMQAQKRPPAAAQVPDTLPSLHASEYRNASALPPGAILVVGAAQSGCQIAEDLLAAGRRVYLATSRVPRVPRRYRGRDIFAWLDSAGFWAQRPEDLADPAMRYVTQPQISGVGPRGHTVSLQWLAERGVALLGRFEGYRDGHLLFGDDLGANVRFADESSARMLGMVDAAIERMGIAAPPREDDPADRPHPNPDALNAPRRLDVAGETIGAVVWCTGFTAGFPWLRVPALDADGQPVHTRGVSNVPGVYFTGFPWLTSRGSGLIRGAGEDARTVVEHLATRASMSAG